MSLVGSEGGVYANAKGTERGMISYPGIRSRDVLWCAQKRAHAGYSENGKEIFR